MSVKYSVNSSIFSIFSKCDGIIVGNIVSDNIRDNDMARIAICSYSKSDNYSVPVKVIGCKVSFIVGAGGICDVCAARIKILVFDIVESDVRESL